MTTETSEGEVCFGILHHNAWVMVVNPDGESVSSVDSFEMATRIAAKWLPIEFWPQFAVDLHPNNRLH